MPGPSESVAGVSKMTSLSSSKRLVQPCSYGSLRIPKSIGGQSHICENYLSLCLHQICYCPLAKARHKAPPDSQAEEHTPSVDEQSYKVFSVILGHTLIS